MISSNLFKTSEEQGVSSCIETPQFFPIILIPFYLVLVCAKDNVPPLRDYSQAQTSKRELFFSTIHVII